MTDGAERRETAPGASELLAEARRRRQAGRFREAEALCRESLAREPGNAAAHLQLGLILFEAGRHEDALAAFARVLDYAPASAEAHNGIGAALQKLGRIAEAIASYRTALELRTDFADAYSNLGLALLEQDRTAEALAVLEAGLSAAPERPILHCNMAVALTKTRQLDAAEEHLHESLRLDPSYREGRRNLVSVLAQQRRPEEALPHLEKLLELEPGSAQVHFDLALALLTLGRLEEGWREAEWRWQAKDGIKSRRDFRQLLWRGENIAGRVLLLHGEQGFGDMLQFSRYVPLAAERCRTLYLETPPALERLFRLSFAHDNVRVIPLAEDHPGSEGLPAFDYRCPLLSLPLAFGTTLATIPAQVPYLAPDPAEAAAWGRRLAQLPRPRVGLVWAGAAANPRDGERSLALARLAPLAEVEGVGFVSLQLGEAAAEAAHPPAAMTLHDIAPELKDFAATAAVMANLDLVIGVDTAVIHLAGALAKPVWMLNPFYADWRWLLGRDDSPWYPSLRLFHQEQRDDWESVIARVARALAALSSAGTG